MLKNKRNMILICIVAAVGILMLLVSNSNMLKTNAITDDEFLYEKYAKIQEEKIENFLLGIDGISKANVIITLDTANEIADQNYFSSNDKKDEYTDIYPNVKGVAIACTNGDRYEVKMNVTKLISAYLGISSNRIEVTDIK